MSVKRNSLSGLKALIDVASGSPTGGSTDDLGEGQVYVATIVREIEPGKDFVTKLSKHDQRTSRLYKIKLEEELGNSVTGGEILFSEEDELEEYFSCATGDDKEEIGNFCLNLLPEGVFIASETPEFPSVGDEVYATSDGGIEGRYLLSLKNSMSKGILGGHSQKYLGKASGATGPGQAFKGANGKPVPNEERKTFLLEFIKKDMVRDAVDIKSDFGGRTHPVTGRAGKMHYGVDVGTGRKNSILRAPKDGTITTAIFQGETSRWKNGNYIKMKHDDGTVSIFLHLHTIDEKIRPVIPGKTKEVITKKDQIPKSQKSKAPFSQRKGEERAGGRERVQKIKVKKGDVLGTVGTSGTSTGIHLHWQFSDQRDPYAVVFDDWEFSVA